MGRRRVEIDRILKPAMVVEAPVDLQMQLAALVDAWQPSVQPAMLPMRPPPLMAWVLAATLVALAIWQSIGWATLAVPYADDAIRGLQVTVALASTTWVASVPSEVFGLAVWSTFGLAAWLVSMGPFRSIAARLGVTA